MTKPISTGSIEKATKKSWVIWVEYLDKMRARNLSHKDIAVLALKNMSKNVDNPEWWAQSVAVAYEQHIGIRLPGQTSDGNFTVTVSRTLKGNINDEFSSIVNFMSSQNIHNGHTFSDKRQTTTPKRSNWRCNFDDGSRFQATLEPLSEKSRLILTHSDIDTKEGADKWEEYWRNFISDY